MEDFLRVGLGLFGLTTLLRLSNLGLLQDLAAVKPEESGETVQGKASQMVWC